MTAIEHYREPMTDREQALMERQAELFAKSSLVPAALKNKPADIMAIALSARDVGLDLTLTTLSNFHVINGKVEPSAQMFTGLAGRAGHEVWVSEYEEDHATVCGRRRGSTEVRSVTFTLEQAKKAGLLSKEVWQHYGQDMLVARAAKRLVKMIAPEVILGLPMFEDDEPDRGPVDVTVDRPAAIETSAVEAKPEPAAPGPWSTTEPVSPLADEYDRDILLGRIAALDDEHRDIFRATWKNHQLPAPADLTAMQHEAALKILGPIEEQLKQVRLNRQRAANANLNEAGIKSDEDRHAAVLQATDGSTDSTGSLTAVQVQQVVDYCQTRAKAAEA